MFWKEVKDVTEEIISEQTILDPKLFLFGLYPEKHHYAKNEHIFIDLSLLSAKGCTVYRFGKRLMDRLSTLI